MMKPRKHAELIKAWADGAELETRWANNLEENNWSDWVQFDGIWYLSEYYEYRIKPEPKRDVVKYATTFMTSWHKEKPDTTDNLKLTFDGETGELKSAEVLK